MSISQFAQQLFEYISKVYAIDLPVIRDVQAYNDVLWWQSELIPCQQCQIKEYDTGESGVNDAGDGDSVVSYTGESWLSVTKKSYDFPPALPTVLAEWVKLDSNPIKRPVSLPSLPRRISFHDDEARTSAFADYRKSWIQWQSDPNLLQPEVPDVLLEWLDESAPPEESPKVIESKEVQERFDQNPERVHVFQAYLAESWEPWSKRVLPAFNANALYDELYALHQRLSVEGDRIEIFWGHLLLSWIYQAGQRICHPLVLTPLSLEFHPERRTISLSPSQSSYLELECLRDLEYPGKGELLQFARQRDPDAPIDPWNNKIMRGLSGMITGLISDGAAERTNLYCEKIDLRPQPESIPKVCNTPVVFIRQRTRLLWIDDARKAADCISKGEAIPPFIQSIMGHGEIRPVEAWEHDGSPVHFSIDDEELFFPLSYNEQQRQILEKLNKQFGVLVQGPPGTGKSHTISNIICSLLASGKRVLVTSQTENALKVLRNYIPEGIRSLCVSHLGNDTESKRQMDEAVEAIGQRLPERNNKIAANQIQSIYQELKDCREKQAVLTNRIKGWVELSACKLLIGDVEVTAQQAAIECSKGEELHTWLPDKLDPQQEPPLDQAQLTRMCQLIQQVAPQDRKSCQEYGLPDFKNVLSAEDFDSLQRSLQLNLAKASETISERLQCGAELQSATEASIREAMTVVEGAFSSIKSITEQWQLKILELMVTNDAQLSFWRDFYQACVTHQGQAWISYKKIQGYEIQVGDITCIQDIEVASEDLHRAIAKGKNPQSLLGRIGLSKEARLLFEKVRIDGQPILTVERSEVFKHKLAYEKHLKKFETRWTQGVSVVQGPIADGGATLPLIDIDARLDKVNGVISWMDAYYQQLASTLAGLGITGLGQPIFTVTGLSGLLEILHGQLAEIERKRTLENIERYALLLEKEAGKPKANPLWHKLIKAVKDLSVDEYRDHVSELNRLASLAPVVGEVENLAARLRHVAPLWTCELESKAIHSGASCIPEDWQSSWRWKRLDCWLVQLHDRESIETLQQQLERERRREREINERLVQECTWQRQLSKIKDHHYLALTAWKSAMKLFGKGKGKYAQRYLGMAQKAMLEAVDAVPAWIMPLHRVVQSFKVEPGIFDVVIVDEASQCDLRALSVLFRGKKILVVGDPEQISPQNVGIPLDKINELISIYLNNIQHPERFSIQHSLYDICSSDPKMNHILLTEHFRCIPSIIEFNNNLCPSYGGRLEPLRQPHPEDMLEPAINTVFVEDGYKRNGDVNEPEARAIVQKIKELCQEERYQYGGKGNRKRTFGVISLLGEKQAKYISDLLAQELNEVEMEERQIICGDAYAFQGDERDVMFLSLVIATNAAFTALVQEKYRQSFNVATSRARDQVFLFHSVRLEDIRNPECVRYKLLSWYLNPPKFEMEAGLEIVRQMADSDFEIEVAERIIRRGYKVIPQYRPFSRDFKYRIDLVVQGKRNRIAVECDGDRHHGPERWEYDQRREAQLRRAGWKFWRVDGSVFYRNKDRALEGLWRFLDEQGITPYYEGMDRVVTQD